MSRGGGFRCAIKLLSNSPITSYAVGQLQLSLSNGKLQLNPPPLPSGVARGAQGAQPPILQTKHKHRPTYKLHEICQFDQFIFKKITKIVATRSHLLKLKCIKFDFG